MSSSRQDNYRVSGGGGCNKLIDELASPFGGRQETIRGGWQRTISKHLSPQPGRYQHILPPTPPADPMDATIVDERLAGFDLARVFCGVVVLDPFRVVPDVLLVNANSAKSS